MAKKKAAKSKNVQFATGAVRGTEAVHPYALVPLPALLAMLRMLRELGSQQGPRAASFVSVINGFVAWLLGGDEPPDIDPVVASGVLAAAAEGSQKYGDWNRMHGMPQSNLLNHGLHHLWRGLIEGDTSEDHLGHAGWNLFQLWDQSTAGDYPAVVHDMPYRPEALDSSHAEVQTLAARRADKTGGNSL